MKKPTPAQLAARARFAEMARSGAFKRKAKAAKKAKANPRKKTVSQKISQLVREGYPQKQAVAVALSEQRAGKVKATPRKRNPVIPSASYDYPLINDVKLFAVNDEMLYRQQGRPIVENLARKMVKGQFDADKAVKLYGYLADSAVKKYSVDYVGSRAPTLTILSKPERQVLAQHLFEFYADEIKDAADEMAESKRKRNPATGRKGSGTKLNPKPRTAKIAWSTPGGQREVMEVPIDFAFKEYIGNIQQDFFARKQKTKGVPFDALVVSEKSTGYKVGVVPRTLRSVFGDRAAAKQFVQDLTQQVGAEKFNAQIALKPKIA